MLRGMFVVYMCSLFFSVLVSEFMFIVHVYHVYDYIISAQISVTFDPFMSLSVPIP